MNYLKTFENSHKGIPHEFEELETIALKFNNSADFARKLNHNELGHDRDNAFLGERYSRLNRGYTLDDVEEYSFYDMDESVTIYRTGDKPIEWGDYVYINYYDAEHALDAGQGDKIYNLEVTYGDLIYCTQGSGEFFYSPKHLREFSGERLQDFWETIHGKRFNSNALNERGLNSIYNFDDFKLNEAKKVGTLYHFTSLVSLYHIIKYNQLESIRELEHEAYDTYKSLYRYRGGVYTFSFTRNKNLHKQNPSIDTPLSVRLELDGDKMSNKYKIRPYAWQGRNASIPKHRSDESEEMVVIGDTYFKDIDDYLITFNIPLLNEFEVEFEVYVNSEPSEFGKLLSIVEDCGGYEDFDENDDEYNQEMVEEIYYHIKRTIDELSTVPFSVKNI